MDEAIRFSAARFFPKISSDAVWDAIVIFWTSEYTGVPQNMRVDEGSLLRKIFGGLATIQDVYIEKSGAESHESLGIGERYQKPLRDTYGRLKLDHPSI